ncbi:MAG TPA: zinc-ribbon domain-containing protein [Pyrinomonadaceae bacterium]|nr:zinc-ribbon domain-containing protein [Pyrinomonadaceae bacterium]
MIVVCSNCTTRLQLDDTKIPTRAFTVRCPKCQNIIQAQPPTVPTEPSALSLGETPALENRRYKPQAAAPAFMPEKPAGANDVQGYGNEGQLAANDLVGLLAQLLQQGGAAAPAAKTPSASRLRWERRRALVCVTPTRREAIGRAMVDADYQVYIAEDTSQAIERMREEQMDVVILETEFDPVEQGAAFVTSEINVLTPAKRRRLVFVHLSPTARTLDSHAAFVQNVNLVVNTADVENLPQVLERTMRDFNDLYRDFNAAHNIAAI